MIGSNVPLKGGLHKCFYYADLWGCDCIQVYLTLSRRWLVKEINENNISDYFYEKNKSSVKEVVAHIPFIVNIASPDLTLRKKSVDRLVQEINIAKILNVNYLVLHPGNTKETVENGIDTISESLNNISSFLKNTKIKICLETMAGQKNVIGSKFIQLANILDKLYYPDHFGICFDTAHVFISGYDLRSYEGYDTILNNFDDIIGLKKIDVIHLNDSKSKLGSGYDRHTSIGDGYIGLQTFHSFLVDNRFKNIPKILEIPNRDKDTLFSLNLLRSLNNKESIEDQNKYPSLYNYIGK